MQQLIQYTVDSCYYDTAGINEMYQYIQTIDKTSVNLYCLVRVRIQIIYRKKQYFAVTDIITQSLRTPNSRTPANCQVTCTEIILK